MFSRQADVRNNFGQRLEICPLGDIWSWRKRFPVRQLIGVWSMEIYHCHLSEVSEVMRSCFWRGRGGGGGSERWFS